MKNVITISREFGSGGRTIGKETAKELGYAFYDRDLIHKIAEESGLSKEYIEERGESAPKMNYWGYAFVGRDSSGNSVDDYLWRIQRDIIENLAEKGNCVKGLSGMTALSGLPFFHHRVSWKAATILSTPSRII